MADEMLPEPVFAIRKFDPVRRSAAASAMLQPSSSAKQRVSKSATKKPMAAVAFADLI